MTYFPSSTWSGETILCEVERSPLRTIRFDLYCNRRVAATDLRVVTVSIGSLGSALAKMDIKSSVEVEDTIPVILEVEEAKVRQARYTIQL